MSGKTELNMVQIISEKYAAAHHFIFSDEHDYQERIGKIQYPLSIIIAYLLIIKFIGPLVMKPFKPLKMNGVLIVFNVSIVYWNAYVSYYLFRHLYHALSVGRLCHVRANVENLRLLNENAYKYIWLFYISKYVDLLDTFFFVLRKKERQVSFLHVFHHSIVIFILWGGIRFDSTGNYHCVTMALNSFVHVCTYSYYALSACGPQMQKFLIPNKIYLTFIQVAQFWVILAYITWSHFSGCERLDIWVGSTAIFLLILMLLFADFYVQNYLSKKKQ